MTSSPNHFLCFVERFIKKHVPRPSAYSRFGPTTAFPDVRPKSSVSSFISTIFITTGAILHVQSKTTHYFVLTHGGLLRAASPTLPPRAAVDSSLERRPLQHWTGLIYYLCCKLAAPLSKALLVGPSTRFYAFLPRFTPYCLTRMPGLSTIFTSQSLFGLKMQVAIGGFTMVKVVYWRRNVQHLLSLDLAILVKRSTSPRPSS